MTDFPFIPVVEQPSQVEVVKESKKETPKEEKEPKAGLYYGQSSNSRAKKNKGEHADRRDVVYKGLLRGVKTTLCQKFEDFTGKIKFSKQTKGCPLFKQKVEEFLDCHSELFKSLHVVFGDGSEDFEYFTQVLAIFLEKGSHFPNKSKETKGAAKALKS